MSDTQRLILAVVLSVLIIMGYATYQQQYAPIPTANNSSVNSTADVNSSGVAADGSSALVANNVKKTLNASELLTLKNDNITLFLNPSSGNIFSATVKPINQYQTLVPHFNDNGTADYLQFNLDSLTGYSCKVVDNSTISCSAAANNFTFTKTYHLVADNNNLVNVTYKAENLGSGAVALPFNVSVGSGGSGFAETFNTYSGPAVSSSEKIIEENDVSPTDSYTVDNPTWSGYSSRYFLFALIDHNNYTQGFIKNVNGLMFSGITKNVTIEPGKPLEESFNIYIGPKSYNQIKYINEDLVRSIDFGWFAFLAIPLYQLLMFLYSFVGNYGYAIVLMTIIVRLVMFPLTYKGVVSMAKISKLAPQLKELKEKYGDDKEKMNAATMKLYRDNNANPLAGCLPLLLQIPIFIALYKAILTAVELYGSPFAFWLVDLSAKDPYYVFPILMGGFMFVQQRLTPTNATMDPIQRKVFLFLPLIFTVMFVNFPSGLTLYYTVSNFLSVLQQIIVNKLVHQKGEVIK